MIRAFTCRALHSFSTCRARRRGRWLAPHNPALALISPQPSYIALTLTWTLALTLALTLSPAPASSSASGHACPRHVVRGRSGTAGPSPSRAISSRLEAYGVWAVDNPKGGVPELPMDSAPVSAIPHPYSRGLWPCGQPYPTHTPVAYGPVVRPVNCDASPAHIPSPTASLAPLPPWPHCLPGR